MRITFPIRYLILPSSLASSTYFTKKKSFSFKLPKYFPTVLHMLLLLLNPLLLLSNCFLLCRQRTLMNILQHKYLHVSIRMQQPQLKLKEREVIIQPNTPNHRLKPPLVSWFCLVQEDFHSLLPGLQGGLMNANKD